MVNTHCKVSGMIIILGLSMASWFFYNKFHRKHNGDSFEFTVFKFPHQMKCLFPNVALKEYKNDCDNADFDGWSVLHVILYTIMGILFPGEYIIVLFLSIFSELWEYLSGWRARWIVDPIVNIVSYWIGSRISYHYNWDLCKKYQISGWYSFGGMLVLSTFVMINNPNFIGLEKA